MPLHTQINLALLAGSFTFCMALGISGHLLQKKEAGLPPVPLFPGSKFPDFFATFYTVFFVLTFGAAAAAQCMGSPEESEPDTLSLISNAIVQTALYLPFLIIYFTLPGRNLPPVSLLRKLCWLFFGLLALFVPAMLVEWTGFTNYLIEWTDCPVQQDVVTELAKGSVPAQIIMLVMAVIIAPVTEECCFRGFVYNILKQKSSPVWAAVGSAFLFSAVHTSLAHFVPLAIFGLVQCYMYEKARTLWVPVILHMLFNALNCLFILLYSASL